MTYQGLQKTLNRSLITLGIGWVFLSILCIGGGGAINDRIRALPEMEELERKGLLKSPPETTSDLVKLEIKLVGNTDGLKKYIAESDATLSIIETCWTVVAFLFFLCLIARLYFRKSKFKDNALVNLRR